MRSYASQYALNLLFCLQSQQRTTYKVASKQSIQRSPIFYSCCKNKIFQCIPSPLYSHSDRAEVVLCFCCFFCFVLFRPQTEIFLWIISLSIYLLNGTTFYNLKVSFLTLSLFFLHFNSSNAFSKRPVPVKDNSKILNITGARVRSDALLEQRREQDQFNEALLGRKWKNQYLCLPSWNGKIMYFMYWKCHFSLNASSSSCQKILACQTP